MPSSFDDVLEDLRALSLNARLDELWSGDADAYREGFRAYVEEVGQVLDTAKRYPGTGEIDGMFLRTVANNLRTGYEAPHESAEWHEGVMAAMWLLVGAHWRDIDLRGRRGEGGTRDS